MKRIYFLLLLPFVLLNTGIKAQEPDANNHFYYYGEKPFFLNVDYSRISIVSEGEFAIDKDDVTVSKLAVIENSIKSHTGNHVVADRRIITPPSVDVFITEIRLKDNTGHEEYSSLIQSLKQSRNVLKVLPAYLISNKELSISNNFYVKLFKADDVEILQNMAEKHSIQVLGKNEFMPLWYTLSCTRETPFNTVEAANLFYESQLYESAEPEFLYHDLSASNDEYFPNQWGLKNTGQYCSTLNIDIHAESAWNITTGSSNIRVAVFDQGIKMDHPDLENNIYGTGYDAETNTTPSVIRGDHGTPCSGIIGAVQGNSIGISGVSPGSKLMSISIYLDWGNTPQQLANGFNWAWQNGADIISNSWGGYSPSSIIDNAITNTLAQGRNGKGTIVVFASGNENNTNIRYPGNSNPDILVVGAISPAGERKSYTSCDGEGWGSCYGTQLDIMAPGVLIPTTTYTGGYTQTFNGTSSACPHVAGVAALVLSENPNLTGQQVRNIIENTAQKVGGYTYQTTSGRPNGTWNDEMGYGLVDAYAAVQAAASCVNSYTNQTVTTNTTVTGCNTLNVQNVTVTNGAKLTLNAPGEVIINGTFEVLYGSSLEVQ
jgi:subtilisin family serine protease